MGGLNDKKAIDRVSLVACIASSFTALLSSFLFIVQLEATLRRIEDIAVGMEGARGEEAAPTKGGIGGVMAAASRLKGGSKKLNSVYPL